LKSASQIIGNNRFFVLPIFRLSSEDLLVFPVFISSLNEGKDFLRLTNIKSQRFCDYCLFEALNF